VEVRDEADTVLFHRVLHDPLRTSVEVPGRRVPRRAFGAAAGAIFEVLVPDDPAARTVVVVGDPPTAPGAPPALSRELARFDLVPGGATPTGGGAS
jgi:hypothetical protein